MGAAATDHVFLDGGHTVDFTNKAFEVLDHTGWNAAPTVLPTLVQQTADGVPGRRERSLAPPPRPDRPAPGGAPGRQARTGPRTFSGDEDVDALAWSILGDDPAEIVAALDRADDAGATAEELARAVAYAAALRVTRFHTQNDHGDWDVVHHGFTAANAVHQLVRRAPTPELTRGVYHGALKVFLDRFLNVPAGPPARPAPASRRRSAGRPRRLLGSAGPHRRSRRHRVRMAARRRPQPGRPGGARLRPPARGRRVPLVPDVTRRPSASRPPGQRAPSSKRSSWPGRPGSWPPIRRPGASCPRSCASPPGCAGASRCTS